jgi:signal transduction histidine kinase
MYLLFAGIILMPFLTLIGAGFFLRLTGEIQERIAVPVYEEIAPWLNENMKKSDWEKISFHLARTRRGMETVILTTDLRVIFSTMEELPAGYLVSQSDLSLQLKTQNGRYSYSLQTFPRISENLLVLNRFDHDDKITSPMFMFFLLFLIAVGVTILFVMVMIIIIIRSLTSSVTMLEKATRRIASGDFDLAVDIKGSNEIASLGHSLNTMRLELKEDELRRSRFVMGMSHDLKTPLALIRGYAEAIEDGIDTNPGALHRSTTIITSKVQQLEGMIDDLMDVVHIDSGDWRETMQSVCLAEYLEEMCREIKQDSEIFHRVVETAVNIDPSAFVLMDSRLVSRALINIVNNAIRYTRENDRIRFSAFMQSAAASKAGEAKSAPERYAPHEGKAVIEITDNGPGIKADDLPHIFERFYRGTSSRREQGMGLGLALVKGIIDSHGWKITVSSREHSADGGTCFRITLPVRL